MLTRRATAYGNSRSKVVLAYLQPSRRTWLAKCAPKIAKKSPKSPILGSKIVRGHQ